jgi:hypothetical protein
MFPKIVSICRIAASNGGRSLSLGSRTVPGLSYQILSAITQQRLNPCGSLTDSGQSQNYVTTDGQSASLSWCLAPICGPRQDLYYRQSAAGLLIWGALSNERIGLSFTIAASPRQRSHIYRL